MISRILLGARAVECGNALMADYPGMVLGCQTLGPAHVDAARIELASNDVTVYGPMIGPTCKAMAVEIRHDDPLTWGDGED